MTNYAKLLCGQHGQVMCTECNRVLASCKCFQCIGRVVKTVCDECKEEKKEGEDV